MIKEGTVILGIDPGTNILGFGILCIDAALKPQYVDMGVLDLRKIASPYDKLEMISEKVGALCDLHHPQCLAIESPFYGKNAQVIFKLGRAQGAAMVAALSRGAEVFEYAPREAKMAICGNGAASKEQVCRPRKLLAYKLIINTSMRLTLSRWRSAIFTDPQIHSQAAAQASRRGKSLLRKIRTE